MIDQSVNSKKLKNIQQNCVDFKRLETVKLEELTIPYNIEATN